MVPRTARIVVPDTPYHVTRRRNRREDIFFCDADRLAYLRFLKQYARQHAMDIHAYCLMTNHGAPGCGAADGTGAGRGAETGASALLSPPNISVNLSRGDWSR